jgi:cobaltochelatase CobN
LSNERLKRNMVQRIDGRMVNAGMRRGMLFVCATGCCCGHTDRGYLPVPTDLYHQEWERRKLRNTVHLNQGGCLGPCPLANVAMLMLDGRPYWFHSLDDGPLIVALYDYIEALLAAERHVPPPVLLAPHLFNGFAWDGSQGAGVKGRGPESDPRSLLPDPRSLIVLSQADTDLLALQQARAQLPPDFAPLQLAHVGRVVTDAAVDAILDELLPHAAVVVCRLHSARSFAYGLERLHAWAAATGGFLLCIPAVEALDPDLMARSTVGVPLAHLVNAYFQCGGAANLANGLSCLSDHLLLTGWGYEPPVELPMHGVYRGSGVRGQGSGDAGQKEAKGDADGYPVIPGFAGVAEEYGSGDRDLPTDSTISSRGAVRTDEPDQTSSSLSTGEYCGGLRANSSQRVPASPVDRARIADGGGDPSPDRGQADLPESRAGRSDLESVAGGGSPPQRLDPVAEQRQSRWEGQGSGRGVSTAGSLTSAPRLPIPVIGILFYRAHMLSGNTAFVDAIIAEVERQGMLARAVYTQSLKEGAPGALPTALQLLVEAGPVDVILNTLSFAIGDGEPHPFAALGAPVIQAITSSSSRAEWARNGRGLGPLDTAMNVAIPEFDGRIIGVPVSFKEPQPTFAEAQPQDGPAYYAPDTERITRLVGMAHRLSALRHTPNAEKRIAFVFTNSSAKAQRVGNAVGLDAPASLLRLLHTLHDAGYAVGDLPDSSDQLIADLIARCSYDETWLTTEQLVQAQRVAGDQYERWFAELPQALQQTMIHQWGPPPGDAYVHQGDLALAGIELGNVFVALQPPRGYDMNPNAIYHQPDLPPPHNYYALYRWLRDAWQADAIVHVGKHGTLEWLPGKGIGLGATCFPDQFLGDLPLIYPFIINDPGEGTQAKRRAHAVIVDHMTPPMTSAGMYGDLAELAQLVDEYYRTEQLDPSKLPLLQRQIWEVIQRSKLDDDLRHILKADHGDHSHDWDGEFLDDGTPTVFAELEGREVAHLLEDIEGYLCELTGAQIRDGLHILGTVPEGEQLVELLYQLLRLPNIGVPSLPAAVAEALDEDWHALQSRPGQRRAVPRVINPRARTNHTHAHPHVVGPGGHGGSLIRLDDTPSPAELRTNADTIAHIEEVSKALLHELDACGWDSAAVDPVLTATELSTQYSALSTVLLFACTELVPKLRRGATDEIAHMLAALEGRYIPAGPSGAPTRGMAHVLPTGRNFYGVDPRALPSVAAWQTGVGLADDLIARYRREHGSNPESVGISIWGTSAIRTAGDDVAQVLALLGVRPRWQNENRRVIGVEVIPLAELGRPRIDVVCRISGFFRDAFPHLISLIDQAVQTVIALDEPPEQNFPRTHALASARALQEAGKSVGEAEREAAYRIFGSKPGSYGAGILPLIDAQNWERDADFARAYLTWGGYAYTASEEGAPAEAAFAIALSGVQVATKNQDTREHDIFDSDDYLQFHGGMIATIRALTGKNPARYFGDSSDPARPKTRDLREEARRVFRSRVTNPKWIASMQRHGYKGGLELAATVDYLFGYDATAETLEDWMYEQVTERYLRDEAVQQWLEQVNPWALQAMAERLSEAHQRGMWATPSAEALATLSTLLERGEEWREGVSRPAEQLSGDI